MPATRSLGLGWRDQLGDGLDLGKIASRRKYPGWTEDECEHVERIVRIRGYPG